MTSKFKSAALFIFAVAMVGGGTAYAVGDQSGRISGVVTEAGTGAAVPGATITVSGKALLGKPRVVNTDDNGNFEVTDLPPSATTTGTYPYLVEVGFEGVKPLVRKVIVRQGETVPLKIAWSPEVSQAEVTNIIEERHMTKPDSAAQGTVLTLESQSKIASGRDYQDIANQVAGVKDNGTGNPNIHGALSTQNHYLVDGMDITDPVTNTFSANINFDSVSSEQVLIGGMEAEYNSMGGVINLITAAGGDELHIDSSFYVNNGSFSNSNQFGPQLYYGVKPFDTTPRPASQSYQGNLNVGGPILKHKLWFNASVEYDYTESSNPAGPPLNVQHPSRRFQSIYIRGKLTWAPSDKHRLTLSLSADPAFIDNVDQSNGELAIAEDYQKQGGVFTILQWDYFKSQNVNTNITAGFQYSALDYGPQGTLSSIDYGAERNGMFSPKNSMYNPEQPVHFNNDDGTAWYQGSYPVGHDRRYRVQFDPSISLRGKLFGSHDAKIGIQSSFLYHTVSSHIPGGQSYNDAGGGPGEGGLCDPTMTTGVGCFQRTDTPDSTQHQWGVGVGLFLQDRWKTPWKRLTIIPGFRVDYGYTANSIGQAVSNMLGLGPRLGFTIDITGDQKTIFTGFYGRANETLSLLPAANADVTAVSKTYQWSNPGGPGQFNYLQQSGGASGYTTDPNHGPGSVPHTDEVMFDLRREVFHDTVAAIAYTYKKMSNIWDGIEQNQVWDPSGNRVVGYANGQQQTVFKYTTPDANWRIYQGIDFTVESKPSSNWDIYAGYTLSWLYGPGRDEFGQVYGGLAGNSQFYNPRQSQFFYGFLPEDSRHQIKLHGSYTWKGLVLGANFSYASGGPLTTLYFNPHDGGFTNRRSPAGTSAGTPNDASSITEFRLPDVIVVNVRVAYDIGTFIKHNQHLTVIADLFNVFDLNAVTGVTSQNLGTFGQVNSRQSPFRFQIGLRYQY